VAAPFSIEFRWKEEVIYWEGDDGFVFEGGWGVTPSVTYIPSVQLWDRVVPGWMQGRRDEILANLRTESGHRLEEGDWIFEQTPDRAIRRGAG
jgi:hypothetical protein